MYITDLSEEDIEIAIKVSSESIHDDRHCDGLAQKLVDWPHNSILIVNLIMFHLERMVPKSYILAVLVGSLIFPV